MRSGLEVVFFEEESAENLLSMRFSKRAITSSPVYRSTEAPDVFWGFCYLSEKISGLFTFLSEAFPDFLSLYVTLNGSYETTFKRTWEEK